MNEEALLLGRHGTLLGVYTPAAPTAPPDGHKIAFVLFNAGLIHHVGPHRFHVKLARALATLGMSTLRVDLSGLGDSSARPDYLSVQQLVATESREILDALARRGHDAFVLCGICAGATHAKLAAAGDPRVEGVVLINPVPDVQDPDVLARMAAQLYLRRSVWNPRAWLHLFTGRVRYRALFETMVAMLRRLFSRGQSGSARPQEVTRQSLEPLLAQGTRVLTVLSDRYAQAFMALDEKLGDLQRDGRLAIEVHEQADHLFTLLEHEKILLQDICRWAAGLPAASGAQPAIRQRTPAAG